MSREERQRMTKRKDDLTWKEIGRITVSEMSVL